MSSESGGYVSPTLGSIIAAKQKQREDLQREVDEWIEKGGKVEQLDTNFRKLEIAPIRQAGPMLELRRRK